MMSSPKKSSLIDPDYEITEVARERIRVKEQLEKEEKAEKIVNIINREFKFELDCRKSQLELIQHRLNRAQKTLHLLRYVLINAYYRSKELIEVQPDESSPPEEYSILNKNRVHPAIKKLLGSNSDDYKLNFIKSPRKKHKYLENTAKSEILNEISKENDEYGFNLKTEDYNIKIEDFNFKTEECSTNVDTTNTEIHEEYDTVRNRKKVKYHVVVGNISKWMPSESEEDKSTHKWMVYVRGSKENPDISHFVQKVVFYLHPSYQPNDVVELRHPPFHLSRRGWGEFPLRVKIFFQYSLNKPVDIIHNLKLDKTFTGQQTLGNETIVNLFLYKDEKIHPQKTKRVISETETSLPGAKEVLLENGVYNNQTERKCEKNGIQLNSNNCIISNLEHDYCYVKHKQNTEQLNIESNSLPTTSGYNYLTEHSYALNKSSQSTNSKEHIENTVEQQSSDYVFGIKDMDSNKSEIIEETVLDDVKPLARNNIQDTYQKFIVTNGTIIAMKKRKRPQESLLKKICYKQDHIESIDPLAQNSGDVIENFKQSKHIVRDICPLINYKKYRVDFPSHRFKNAYEALPYLFKRLPLVTELGSDLDYKRFYPYVAKTLEEYKSWNIAKRSSSEWFRAKLISKMITEAQLPNYKCLSVKSLITYARLYGYTPFVNYKIYKKKSHVSKDILNGKIENKISVPRKDIELKNIRIEPDIIVDVINCTSDPDFSTAVSKEKLVNHKLEGACCFVKESLLDIGIILKPEDIIPGVSFNSNERILLQAILCLAEDIIRRARANLVLQGNFCEETSIIQPKEINQALHDRSEFHILLKSSVKNVQQL